MMDYSILDLPVRKREGLGSLSFIEGEMHAPFQINRLYYIYDVPLGGQRGGHAHRQLTQLLFCPYGSIEILLDDGIAQETVILDRPNKALVIGPGMWRDMIWRCDNSVLCVAASEHYDENDYIRDYSTFIEFQRKQKKEDADG